jgi:Domain of unknown function DUF11
MKKLILLSLFTLLALTTKAQVPSADVSIFRMQGLRSNLCTVTVLNTHDDDAQNVKLEILVPFQTTATTVSAGCVVQTGGRVVICDLGTMTVNERKSVTINTDRNVPLRYRTNLYFSAYVSNSLPDPNLGNNFRVRHVSY